MKLDVDGNAAKRRKVEELENAIAVTTFRILETKKRHQLKKPNEGGSGDGTKTLINNSNETENQKKLTKHPPICGVDWFGVSCSNTIHRGYLRARQKRVANSFTSEWENHQENRTQISRSFCFLIEEVRRESDFNVLSSNPLASIKAFEESFEEKTKCISDSTLWIDKYMPKNFLDLVTEDQHNRLTLLWLRLWDEYVFHKKFNMSSFSEKDVKFLEIDEKHKLPRFKILVIQGPSGIGKSTLAYVAANQAGYRPFVIGITEIQNMNDFRAKLDDISNLGSIQSLLKGTISQNLKPTCLIIDGIDYASTDMIKFLANWSTTAKKANLRPIICTCNNLYVQNLRELRSHCLILKIPECNKQRLFKRLQDISKTEGIRINNVDLQGLLELCRLDIRLCLNTLQFYYKKASNSRQATCLRSSNNGFNMEKLNSLKNGEGENSIFETMDAIMTLDHHVNKKGMPLNVSERCHRIQNLMNQRDDLDRFYQALFYNFTDAIKLTNAQRRKAAEYFVNADMNYQIVYSTQNFILLKYQSFLAIALHLCIAVHVSRRLMFNLTFMSFAERKRESRNIVLTVRNGVMRSGLSFCQQELVHNVLPLLFYIIQPPIQGVNVQLFSGQDLSTIQRVIAVMCSFKISYVLKYEEIGANYCFDPAINSVVSFSKTSITEFLSNKLKKYITHQIEVASIRGENIPLTPTASAVNTPARNSLLNSQRRHDIYENFGSRESTIDKNLSIPATPLAMKRCKEFSGFSFTYNQGSSQAVRRNITIDALFFK